MSYAASRSELLAARDGRQSRIEAALAAGFAATVALGLNIPGADKAPPGSEGLFAWGVGELARSGLAPTELFAGADPLGPFALFGSALEAAAAKRFCLDIEAAGGHGRLLDLDVYDRAGRPLDRAALGLPQRPCLLCARPGRECIRLARHAPEDLLRRTRELLAPFCD